MQYVHNYISRSHVMLERSGLLPVRPPALPDGFRGTGFHAGYPRKRVKFIWFAGHTCVRYLPTSDLAGPYLVVISVIQHIWASKVIWHQLTHHVLKNIAIIGIQTWITWLTLKPARTDNRGVKEKQASCYPGWKTHQRSAGVFRLQPFCIAVTFFLGSSFLMQVNISHSFTLLFL